MTRRTERIAETMRHEIGRILLADLNDPRVGFVTVTRVQVAPDLSVARVYLSVMGGEGKERTALRGLSSAHRRIQARLRERMDLRRMPALSFQIDDVIKEAARMDALLSEIAHERAAAGSVPADTAPPAEGSAPNES